MMNQSLNSDVAMRQAYSPSKGEGENVCVIGPQNEIVVEITYGREDFQWECAKRIAAMMLDWKFPRLAIPMILHCPDCGARHVDAGEFARKPHHTHACQSCGFAWRPAKAPTIGVQFLPGFKDDADA